VIDILNPYEFLEEFLKMAESKPSREQLTRRRDEINEQLDRVNREQRVELDRDPEEQAIQIEHDQVAVSMEENLRRELAMIEDELLEQE
jgi:hypothetical protein